MVSMLGSFKGVLPGFKGSFEGFSEGGSLRILEFFSNGKIEGLGFRG